MAEEAGSAHAPADNRGERVHSREEIDAVEHHRLRALQPRNFFEAGSGQLVDTAVE